MWNQGETVRRKLQNAEENVKETMEHKNLLELVEKKMWGPKKPGGGKL